MLELLAFIFLGIALGTITGLLPGLHTNAVAFFLLGLPLAIISEPAYLMAAITSLAVTHNFLDFVPSIYLGAPDPESSLSVLPGHRMLLQGKGLEALTLTSVGGMMGLVVLLISTPILLELMPAAYAVLQNFIPSILLTVISFMILGERNKPAAIFVVLISGILGLLTLKYEISLFAGLTGFFGISTLLYSIFSRSKSPPQTEYRVSIESKEGILGSIGGFLAGIVLASLPAMGASQAGVISQYAMKGDERKFLVSLGAINSVVTVVSVMTLYLIGRARSGAAVAVERVVKILTAGDVFLVLGVGLAASGIASILAIAASRQFSRLLRRFDYRKVSLLVIAALLGGTFLTGGVFGLVLLCATTAVGLYSQCVGVRKSHCMGFLIIPTTLLYVL